MVMAKWNYKFFADLGLQTQFMARSLTVLDTGARPTFVIESVLPPQLEAQIRTHAILDISDAKNNPLHTVGTIAFVVRLGPMVVKLDFIVFQSLAAPVVFACDYCDRYVESIRSCPKQVEVEEWTVSPMFCQPPKRATKWQVPLTAKQEAPPSTRESSKQASGSLSSCGINRVPSHGFGQFPSKRS